MKYFYCLFMTIDIPENILLGANKIYFNCIGVFLLLHYQSLRKNGRALIASIKLSYNHQLVNKGQ